MFNKNQLLIGMLVFDIVIQHHVLRQAVKENDRRGKIIDYLIEMMEKYDIEYDEFDVIALSDLGITFKEKDASA
jgi:hypothetical protein